MRHLEIPSLSLNLTTSEIWSSQASTDTHFCPLRCQTHFFRRALQGGLVISHGENAEELLLEQRTAYIEYEDPKDAEDAARDMDGKMLEKVKIRNSASENYCKQIFVA